MIGPARPLALAVALLPLHVASGKTGPTSTGLTKALQSAPPKGSTTARTTPRSDPTEEPLTILESGTVRTDGDVVSSSDRISIRYRDEDFEAEGFSFDRKARVVTLEGQATVSGARRRVRARRLRIDLATEEVSFSDGTATLAPTELGERLRSPLYVASRDGTLGRARGFASDSIATTCDHDCPHYALASETTTVIVDDRVVLRNARLRVLGRTILRVPYLSLPLDDRPLRQLPEIGETPDEGYYVQVGTASSVSRDLELESTLRYMTKLGALTTFALPYRLLGMAGSARLATLVGPGRSVNGSLRHEQALGTGRLSVSGQLQDNNYRTAPQSRNDSVAVVYAVSRGGATTNVTYQTSHSRTAGFGSESTVATIRQGYRVGRLSQDLSLTLRQSANVRSTGPATRFEAYDVRYQGELRDPRGSLLVEYARTIPVAFPGNAFRSTDTTPQLTFQSDLERLLRIPRKRYGDVGLRVQWGELTNPRGGDRLSRFGFEVTSRGRARIADFVEVDTGSAFTQGVYSDRTAQYSVRHRSAALFGRRDRLFGEVDYTYLRAFGFTPLPIDATGRSDAFGVGLGYSRTPTLSFQVRTGYDVLSGSRGFVPWQSVSLRAEARPTPGQSFTVSSLYDSARSQWSNVRLDFEAPILAGRARGSVRYDARRSVWAATLLEVEALRVGKVTASTLLSYNGYRRAFDHRELALVYDLHCTEAVLSFREDNVGFRTGTKFGLSIRIKAFPFASDFGLGTRGQSIGSLGGFRR